MLNIQQVRAKLGQKALFLSDQQIEKLIELVLNVSRMYVDLFLAGKLK